MALDEALLQSVSPRPGEPEVICVFPAWPREWEAEFRLLARGGFMVSAAIRGGEIRTVVIESRRGETCRFRNCWGGRCALTGAAGSQRQLDGKVLAFDTEAGKTYQIGTHR